ncbi:hypothetical protein [Kineococcus sp. SYSU DK001]|uniref:hypothetical protein n=1 Tax=Kineococcus sp. SYSU DK001 TaxID=3383122 RepID=UPI003D7E6EA6
MNQHDEAHEQLREQDGPFLRLTEGVGDLTNPFHREERQRDVWNEASAVGLQVALWLGTAAATAMVWIGGRTALPYALTTFAVTVVASGFALAHATRLGVRPDDPRWSRARRLVPYGVLVLAFLAGVVQAAPSGAFGSGLAVGAAGGGVLALLCAVIGTVRARRRSTPSAN